MPFWKSYSVCGVLVRIETDHSADDFFSGFFFTSNHGAFVTSSLNYIKDEVFLHLQSLCLASLLIKIFLSNVFVLFPLFKSYVKEPRSSRAPVQ